MPILVRPIPLFSTGFFRISPSVQQNLLNDYPACLKVINAKKNICRVNLNDIWRKSYQDYSFPQFKYLLYTNNADLDFNQRYSMEQALCVTIDLLNNYKKHFESVTNALRKIISFSQRQNNQLSTNDITQSLKDGLKISEYKAESICNVFLSSLEPYNAFNNKMNAVASRYVSNSGEARYSFKSGI
ncbi:MAG: hypothetical protein IJU91_06520 [Selenomonadaceae bacterium]|nr:hypothetical protein [Selenomonadaceae bacterium]